MKRKLFSGSQRELGKFIASDCFSFKGQQGEALGRVGLLEATVKIVEGEPIGSKVGGNAVGSTDFSLEA